MQVAVFGATGKQGGSVVRALSQGGEFHVKAITRNPDSDKAKPLSSLAYVSVHKADLNDPASVDQVLSGCQAVFLVTDIAFNADSKETQQGIDLINSAIKNKVNHVVFSGLDHVKPVIGKTCAHFDNKAAIEDYGLAHGNEITFTSIRLPAYYENFMHLQKAPDGTRLFTMPLGDIPIYFMSADDTGECVKSILKNPNEYKNKIVGVAAEHLKLDQVVELFNKNLSPLQFKNANCSLEKFASFGFPGAEDLSIMCEYFQSGKIRRDIELTKKLNPNLSSFNDWLVKNKDNFAHIF